MKNKYNVALIPLHHADQFIELANTFSPFSHQYLLGNKSHPHVTLYQFYSIPEEIESLWHKISESPVQKTITLAFHNFSYTTLDDNCYWLALTPDQRKTLTIMHQSIANMISQPIKPAYDPHLTLLNFNNNDHAEIINQSFENYQPMSDKFLLALGHSDPVGQLTEIIYTGELV